VTKNVASALAPPLPATGDAPSWCTDLLYRYNRFRAEHPEAADGGDEDGEEEDASLVQTFVQLSLAGSAISRRPMISCAAEMGLVPTAAGHLDDDDYIRHR